MSLKPAKFIRKATMKKIIFFCALYLLSINTVLAEAAKDFSLNTSDGQTVALSNFLGKKTVVLNFWASWCTTCEEEIPQLVKLKTDLPADSVFLGINAGDSSRAAMHFVEKNSYPYEVLLDVKKIVAKQFQVSGIPQTLIINKAGEIVYRGSRPPTDASPYAN